MSNEHPDAPGLRESPDADGYWWLKRQFNCSARTFVGYFNGPEVVHVRTINGEHYVWFFTGGRWKRVASHDADQPAPRSYADGVRDAVKVVERQKVAAIDSPMRHCPELLFSDLLTDLRSLLASGADEPTSTGEQA